MAKVLQGIGLSLIFFIGCCDMNSSFEACVAVSVIGIVMACTGLALDSRKEKYNRRG